MAPGDHSILPNPPSDDISKISFGTGSNSHLLAASSWDGFVYIYNTNNLTYLTKFDLMVPALTNCFTSDDKILTTGADCEVAIYNVQSATNESIGKTRRPCITSHYNIQNNLTLTGSLDKNLYQWDPRAPGTPVKQLSHPDSISSIDSINNKLIVATYQRYILIWDLRQFKEPIETRESSLKFQTRVVRCFPNGHGYVVGSIEGRVALEPFDNSNQTVISRYAFKCHREKDVKEIVYPITDIAINKKYNTFATGGCDGVVNIWDGFNRKRLVQLPSFPITISSMTFNYDDSKLAIASSYMYEQGPKENTPPPSITLRQVNESDIKPKHIANA